jgi:cytochrome c peroxidase
MNASTFKSRSLLRWIVLVVLVVPCAWLPVVTWAATVIPAPTLLPLNQVAVPEPPNLYQFVKNKPAAIKLGKALFWDMQAGSDGVQACATCHFHAGADNRLTNTINPGTRGGDTTFQVRKPNETLQRVADFPFHLRSDPDVQTSTILRDSNDVVGSQGVKLTTFLNIVTGSAVDDGTPVLDPVFQAVFQAGVASTRRVTARNTPTNINAVFNFNNFWDGRAHFVFNGVNPFGPLDPSAGVWFSINGVMEKQPVAIQFASLASQATGPPLDDTEMSFGGRTFPQLGRKMLSLSPLGRQLVHPNDSVLGPLSRAVLQPNGTTTGSNGLSTSYDQMIKDSFQDWFWNSNQLTPEGFTQMEANFSLFWGLAIQLYEATLVSDQTPFDRFLGGDKTALTDPQKEGFNLFFGAAGCAACHISTELSNASVRASAFLTNSSHALIEPMPVASGLQIIYDSGFNNTAVRPTTEDIGRGGTAPFTNPWTNLPFPLSFSALAELQALGTLGFNGVLFPVGAPLTPILPAQIPGNFPVANDGNFKIPGLRNVELTAPYFHNGGDMTLEEVVQFYTRGGNFPGLNQNSLDIAIADINFLQHRPDLQAELVAFMKSMTDERVRNESAPFDHPELFVPNGDLPDGKTTSFLTIPAKNAAGTAASTIAITLDPVSTPTRLASQTLRGTKEPSATVTIRLNGGATFAVADAGITWSANVSGLVTGPNSIAATATDPANQTTTLVASITVDVTPPVLTMDAVTTPTKVATQTISGTVEQGIIPVILVSTTAAASPVLVLNGTSGASWSATLTGLVNGANDVTVLAFDLAGNTAIQSISVVYGIADGKLQGAGVVDHSDALKALGIATGLIQATPLEMLHGDVAPLLGGNSKIDIADALLILRKAEGQVSF